MAKQSGIGEEFLGLIVLPIAGNACEHITAVFVAVKDKMDLAIGVALGSSIQVTICFVLPSVSQPASSDVSYHVAALHSELDCASHVLSSAQLGHLTRKCPPWIEP